MLLLDSPGLAQTPTADTGIPPERVYSQTKWERLRLGGWALIPIGLCSVAVIYLIRGGILGTSRTRIAPTGHEQTVKALFRQGDYVSAYAYCRENSSPLSNVLGAGISSLGDGKQVTEEAVTDALATENMQTRTCINHLLMIAICTPAIGLLGTITGLIQIALRLPASAVGDHPGLTADIGKTLIATASGLVIAILALVAFYLLRNRAAASVLRIRDVVKSVFRRMPYEALAGVRLGDEELYAAPKELVQSEPNAALAAKSEPRRAADAR